MPRKGPRCPNCRPVNVEVLRYKLSTYGRHKLRCRNCGTEFLSKASTRYVPVAPGVQRFLGERTKPTRKRR